MRLWFFLAFLVFVSGCITPENETELRLACLNLSSSTASLIPNCETQNSCLKKLDEKFFSANDSVLSFSTRKQLNEYRAFASLSWHYQNLAIKNLNEINSACSSGNYALLPEEANEFRNNTLNALGNLDKANQKSISVLIAVRGELEKNGIDFVKEEELFNDYIKINNNLVQLSSNSIQTTPESFAGILLEQSKKLNSLTARLYEKDFVQETTALEIVEELDQDLLKLWKNNEFYVPLAKKLGESVSEKFAQKESLINSFNLLNGLDILAMMISLNELNFGSVKEFSELNFFVL